MDKFDSDRRPEFMRRQHGCGCCVCSGPQGPQGEPGRDGADGYTPVRGVDYFTPEEIARYQKIVESTSRKICYFC